MGHHHAWPGKSPYDGFFRAHNYTRAPVLVQWMATQSCPLSCPHCLCGDERPEPELSTGEVEGLLDEIADLGVLELLVTGGEPLVREDLPEVIQLMAERSIRWSLNTSAFPDRACREAMERHPPSFVAVSLDGPPAVHDAFRGRQGAAEESLGAIRYFDGITGGRAAAGTTVSRHNFPHLDETLAVVRASGACSWGLHLVFPEGRAGDDPSLFLTRNQLGRLLSFVESKRRTFPVVLADEIGFTGTWEPALRQAPFFCGAGRAQCLVTSDGEVVPCSTVDRSESEGNVRTRSLGEIWHTGFRRIRGYVPRGKCTSCAYQPACSGGCWLQRRHGVQCFKDVWEGERSAACAASLALCLGLAACGGQKPPGAVEPEPVEAAPAVVEPAGPAIDSEMLEDTIIDWYLEETCHSWVKPASEEAELAADPAWTYFQQMKAGEMPGDLEQRVERIEAALETEFRSLAFASLLWRDLTLWTLEGTPPAERTAEQVELLVETMQAIEARTSQWRRQIYEMQIDSFLSADPGARRGWFMLSKALKPNETVRITKAELSMEHWGLEDIAEEVTEEHVAAHKLGEHLSLEFEVRKGDGLVKLSAEGQSAVGKRDVLGIYDVLVVPEKGPINLAVKSGNRVFETSLPAGTKLLFGDVLRLLYERNRKEMDQIAQQALTSHTIPEPHALHLPALERIVQGLASEPKGEVCSSTGLVLSIWLF
jgi:radical SAM protein with 4Fe4S-binding SPASM domain